ncbi:MAG: LysR family transcriptional regulator [Hyphomonadaceae bacterium]|nr:LysR family transcriptional regulator [Hyphomonadaceae bacterium]MBC6412010.1 LysR family transcriptional regulator [Hyphomonadaceae bacterium]
MNIRDLGYIRALARFGHFSRAAEACHVSQPALSGQIKKLEAELGVILFERDSRSVRITDIGQQIANLAEDALSVVEDIRSTAEAARDPVSGRFRLGSIPTISPYLMPHILLKGRTALPSLRLEFQEDITERLNGALLDGEMDAAILATSAGSSKFDTIPLYDEPFWVIFPNGHSLHRLGGITTKDLPVNELLLLSEGHCFRDQTVDVCRLDGAPEKSAIRASSLETLINMVAAGQGITLIPARALSGGWANHPDVKVEKLDDPNAYRRIYLTYRKTFPRRVLLEKIAHLICTNLSSQVRPLFPVHS